MLKNFIAIAFVVLLLNINYATCDEQHIQKRKVFFFTIHPELRAIYQIEHNGKIYNTNILEVPIGKQEFRIYYRKCKTISVVEDIKEGAGVFEIGVVTDRFAELTVRSSKISSNAIIKVDDKVLEKHHLVNIGSLGPIHFWGIYVPQNAKTIQIFDSPFFSDRLVIHNTRSKFIKEIKERRVSAKNIDGKAVVAILKKEYKKSKNKKKVFQTLENLLKKAEEIDKPQLLRSFLNKELRGKDTEILIKKYIKLFVEKF